MPYANLRERPCAWCFVDFKPTNSDARRYCSVECFRALRANDCATRTHKVCSLCKKKLPVSDFFRASRRADGYQSGCKECGNAAQRRNGWRAAMKYRYGVTAEAYERMLTAQDGGCGICMIDLRAGDRRFAIDHDHACCAGYKSCGKCVRGILCTRCNTGLGMFKDNPERLTSAVAYLAQGVH